MKSYDRVIIVPFAFDDRKSSGINISNKEQKLIVYLKNAANALVSAKKYNHDCDVVFATSIIAEDLPVWFRRVIDYNNIIVLQIDFDRFVFPDEYKWSLAFYKLCSISHILELNYEYLVCLDSDVWVQDTFDYVFEECKYNILLNDINHGLHIDNYKKLCDEIKRFSFVEEHITHYGGEFFAANKKNTSKFIKEAECVYREMIERRFITEKGDEFITSLCAYKLKQIIKNASPYVFRFWTGSFRLISTCYRVNPVLALHVPDEKQFGMIDIFDRYINKNKMPKRNTVWRLLHLTRPKLSIYLSDLVTRIIVR